MKHVTQYSPESYYSTSDGGKTYSLIYKEMPLCVPTTKKRAMEVAEHYGISTTLLWNGRKSQFGEIE